MSKRNVCLIFDDRLANDLMKLGFKLDKIESSDKRKDGLVWFFDRNININIDKVVKSLKNRYKK